MKKFIDTYRVDSARAEWWDYARNGRYYVTICTENREHYFGKIVKKTMRLSHVGVIADIMWHEIKNHTKYVELGVYQVMSNHLHGILHLNYPKIESYDLDRGRHVETLHATSLQSPTGTKTDTEMTNQEQKSQIYTKPRSLSTILRSYKAAVTRHARRLGFPFGWQGRFYDHIIRDDEEYQRIVDYIINNPANWKDDEFFS